MLALLLLSLLNLQQPLVPDPTEAQNLQYLADFVVHGPSQDDLGPSEANASSKRLATYAFIGALLEGHADNQKYDQARNKIAAELEGALTSTSVHTNAFGGWIYPFLTFYFCERALQRDVAPNSLILERLVLAIEELQNVEGGWGHSGGNMASFYPSTLVATTNLNLIALGLAKSFGADVDEIVIEDGFELLRTVQGANGAMPYGGPAYRKGYEAGRTAATLVAYAAHGKTGDPEYQKAAKYVADNLKSIPLGHASTALHLFFGGHAMELLPSNLAADFETGVAKRIRKARSADGSFDDVIEHSPDTMLSVSDQGKYIDRAYVSVLRTTALHAANTMWVQQMKPNNPAPVQASPNNMELSLGVPNWQIAAEDVKRLIPLGDCVASANSHGDVDVIQTQDGSLKQSFAAPPMVQGLERTLDYYKSENSIYQILTDQSTEMRLPGTTADKPDSPAGSCMLRRIDAEKELWRRTFESPISRITRLGNILHVLSQTGMYHALNIADGTTLRSWAVGSALINVSLAPHKDGAITVGVENKVTHHESDGFSIWQKRSKGQRGITPPAWTALVVQEDRLLLGDSQGEVQSRQVEDGKGVWRNLLGGSIKFIAALEALPQHVLVASHDGRLHALHTDDGETAWSLLYSFGIESNQPLHWLEQDGSIWLHHVEAERLLKIDVVSGKIIGMLPLAKDATWTIHANVLYLARNGQLEATTTKSLLPKSLLKVKTMEP